MTPNERKIMEAVIALLDAVTYIRGSGSAAEPLRTHRGILQAALDADRAPRECDPYAKIGGFHPADPVQLAAAARPNSMPPGWIAGLPRAVVRDLTATQQYDAEPSYPEWRPRETSREKRMREINQGTYRFPAEMPLPGPQQYDADPPQEPGRETPEAPK